MSRRLLIALVAGLVTASVAAAEVPWSRGVSAAQQATARELLDKGNQLFLDKKYQDALVVYRKAIAAWDHPAIRFNMVRVHLALDHWIEAADDLDKALAYGAAPLEDNVYQEAIAYQKLVAGRIGTLEVSCTKDDAEDAVVTLDGTEILRCPGKTATLRRLPGTHVVVGTAPQKATFSRSITLHGGELTTIEVEMTEIATGARWARWKPWAVVGGGVALVGAGVVFQLLARSAASDLEAVTATTCADGCTKDEFRTSGLAAREDGIRLRSRLSVGGLVGGGAAVLVGAVLVAMNRSVTREPVVEPQPGGAVVGVRGSF